MIIQKVIKGIGGIDQIEAEKILKEGIYCNWWRNYMRQHHKPLSYVEINPRLTERNLTWHQNNYDDNDPLQGNQPFYKNTPFISTTAGTVERINPRNILHAARDTALEFATDTWKRDGWLFYCYVFILGLIIRKKVKKLK